MSTTSLKIWHEHLGHLNKRAIRELLSKDIVSGIKMTDKNDFFCDACQLRKSYKVPFNKTVEKIRA